MSSISDVPVLQALRAKMQYHQERQKFLANNVANAATPGYQPQELKEPDYFDSHLHKAQVENTGPVLTSAAHIAGSPIVSVAAFKVTKSADFETTPDGNSVNIEDQMMKVTGNQMDFQAAASLYQRGLNLIKLAVGKG